MRRDGAARLGGCTGAACALGADARTLERIGAALVQIGIEEDRADAVVGVLRRDRRGDGDVDRARALLKLNRSQDALPELQVAVKSNPDEPTIHFLLAQAYRASGKTEEAKTEMQVFARLEETARAATAARSRA